MTDENNFPVRVDFDRILQTIAASIYDNQFAFLRENVQNAIDAIRIQAGRDNASTRDARYRIDVKIAGTVCSISDNGIGMTRQELQNNFWTMGASGKTTSEARTAGCIGVFGIGGFANFGVCETLEVISRTGMCLVAHHTSLSKADFKRERFELPNVRYRESAELSSRGTIVRGTASSPFDAKGLLEYLRQFVRFVNEPIFVDGHVISQERRDGPIGTYRILSDSQVAIDGDIELTLQLSADEGNNVTALVRALKVGAQAIRCESYVRLVHGELDVYKRGFRICAVNISSRIGVAGFLDSDILQPTAGRDSLEAKSTTFLTRLFRLIETSCWPLILADSNLLANHIRLLPDLVSHGHLEHLGLLPVTAVDKRVYTLQELRNLSAKGARIFFTQSGQVSSAAEVLQARGHIIIATSSDRGRRSVEVQFLSSFCRAEEFDNLIECLETYPDLDPFERAVIAELELAIRKLFSPPPFRFTAGKLTLDVPIYWTTKKEQGDVVVLVDTRHGEFQKLRALGYSPLFWSMIEAFCREYLGDTLKRQSPKFFGTGAIDLDAYSKSHAELWELLSTDIEVSRIESPDGVASAATRQTSRIEVVRSGDVERLTISNASGVVSSGGQNEDAIQAPNEKPARPPKLLNIVDETQTTGLDGYYLRIPESASAAFGELIRTFPAFVVIWFANRITWQGSDLESTAFLFELSLDQLIASSSAAGVAHGALDLEPKQIQTYKDAIYFFIPKFIEAYIVPSGDGAIKVEIRHELLDLGKPRSWTSRASL